MSVRSGLAASGHRDKVTHIVQLFLKFITIVQISNLPINEVREDPRLFHDADGSTKGVVTQSCLAWQPSGARDKVSKFTVIMNLVVHDGLWQPRNAVTTVTE